VVDQSNRMSKAKISALRTELLTSHLDAKTYIKRGSAQLLGKKYGVSASSIGFHRVAALRDPKAYVKSNGHAPEREQEPEQQSIVEVRKPASREDLDLDAINADIDAGMDADAIREKYNISGSLAYRLKREKQEEEPITPLTAERIARVIEIIANLGKVYPEKFTRLDFLGQISKKYATILAEII
jgi:hypothetical protein